ncbi:hypothetical protein ATY76_22345 [Rhizobium sp. R339]|uniref:class I SAM-dependent methyltransferase n=1 Tax=Rhizobium sp. R339 TaxID=1764273 RepID=UPI000B52B3FE|nr:class I SAM-dependent methyltransferase [Rhizobium sp. R339]OWV64190.1 hypothetical protein ATY76_22345 [Rhizobium sp. R339]
MSRLDNMIRRLTAQRDILNSIRGLLYDDGNKGPIIEFGLGNGRTYDHLRECFPERRIIVFDREIRSFSASTPSKQDFVLGEISESGLAFQGIGAALVHADIGSGHDDIDAVTLVWLPTLVVSLLGAGGIAASGLPLEVPTLVPIPLPEGIRPGRYFLYRKA